MQYARWGAARRWAIAWASQIIKCSSDVSPDRVRVHTPTRHHRRVTSKWPPAATGVSHKAAGRHTAIGGGGGSRTPRPGAECRGLRLSHSAARSKERQSGIVASRRWSRRSQLLNTGRGIHHRISGDPKAAVTGLIQGGNNLGRLVRGSARLDYASAVPACSQ